MLYHSHSSGYACTAYSMLLPLDKRQLTTLSIKRCSVNGIGAKSLYDVAAALQKAIQNEKMEEVKPLYDRFALYLSKLLEEIKGIQI